VRTGDALEGSMWRCVGADKVWYEWALTLAGPHGVVTPIHNPTGRSYWIGM